MMFNKLLFVAILFSLHLLAGGLSTSGGGSGVACFASEQKAKRYQLIISKGKKLPESFFSDIKSLVILETWERENTSNLIKPLKGWQQTLDRIYTHIYYISPLFLFRLKQFADIAKVSEWNNVNNLALLEDANPRKAITSNCLRVQIAKRYSDAVKKPDDGPVEHYITAKIEINKRLFSMLSVLDQALLILHEQLYMVGSSVGHVNSDIMRSFVNLFVIDRQIDRLLLGHFYSSSEIFSIRWKLVSAFGDYPVYFTKEKLPEEILEKTKSPFSPQSRFLSFLQVLLNLREKMGVCNQHNQGEAAVKIPNCIENSIQQLVKEDNLNNEQAFAFVVFFGLDRRLKMNSEYLFDPSLKVMSLKDTKASLFVFCNEIYGELKPTTWFYRQAVEYCEQAQASYN